MKRYMAGNLNQFEGIRLLTFIFVTGLFFSGCFSLKNTNNERKESSLYKEYKTKFTRIEADSASLQGLQPEYLLQCRDSTDFVTIDSTCGRFVGHEFRKSFIGYDQDPSVFFAHSYVKMASEMELFFVEHWNREPFPALCMIPVKNGKPTSFIRIAEILVPSDAVSQEYVRYEIHNFSKYQFQIQVYFVSVSRGGKEHKWNIKWYNYDEGVLDGPHD